MVMENEIWIIGVDPPCPRCDLTRQRVERLSREMGLSANVRHFVFNDPEVLKFSESIGKEFGTAKHVADKASIDMSITKDQLEEKDEQNRPEDFDRIVGSATRWSPKMDELLRPYQLKAESVGMLMTPILVVFGEIKHHGSVPSIEQIKSWLS